MSLALLLAVAALVLVPCASGVAVGRALSPAWALGGAVALLAVAVGVDLALDLFPLWDVVWVLGLGGLVALVAAWRPPAAEVAGWCLGLALACGVGEGAARWVLPAAPELPPAANLDARALGQIYAPRSSHVLGTLDDVCHQLFDAWDGTSPATGGALVLHVGDSVVYGSGVPSDTTFVATLDRRDPQRGHVNAAIPATSVDVALSVARRWFGADGDRPLQAAVLWIFVVNDPDELDMPYLCCPDGLLDAALAPRCTTYAPLSAPARLLARSTPPLVLHALTPVSSLAAHVYARWAGTSALGGWWPSSADRDAAVPRLAAIASQFAAEATAAGVRPVVALAPRHPGTVPPAGRRDDTQARYEALRADLSARGLPVIDAWAWASDRPDAAALFVDTLHLSEAGHAAFADWLAPRLDAMIGASP